MSVSLGHRFYCKHLYSCRYLPFALATSFHSPTNPERPSPHDTRPPLPRRRASNASTGTTVDYRDPLPRRRAASGPLARPPLPRTRPASKRKPKQKARPQPKKGIRRPKQKAMPKAKSAQPTMSPLSVPMRQVPFGLHVHF